MKLLINRIGKSNYARVIEWSKLFTFTGTTQLLIQFLSLISGIMVIRLLPPNEYALYTLANTMLGTMIVLADGGIATAVMSQGGKVWMEYNKLGAVIVTGLRLRKIFALISLPISIVALLYLLRHHGASWVLSFLMILSILPIFFMMLHAGILEISPKLRQDIVQLQKIKVITNFGRLVILSLTIFAFPLAVIALFSASLPQIWANSRYKKISSHYADLKQKIDPVVQEKILKMVRLLLPEAIYYCLSGQIAIWLISVFGSTTSVAQIGALSRLSVILAFFSILFANLIAPRFARLPNNQKILFSRYIQINICLIILSILIISLVWMFSSQILWILGPNYSGLNKELTLMAVSSCISLLYGSSFLLGTYRSWIINPVIFISISIITTACSIILMDVSSLQNIIMLNIFVTLIQTLVLVIFNFKKIFYIERTQTI